MALFINLRFGSICHPLIQYFSKTQVIIFYFYIPLITNIFSNIERNPFSQFHFHTSLSYLFHYKTYTFHTARRLKVSATLMTSEISHIVGCDKQYRGTTKIINIFSGLLSSLTVFFLSEWQVSNFYTNITWKKSLHLKKKKT